MSIIVGVGAVEGLVYRLFCVECEKCNITASNT